MALAVTGGGGLVMLAGFVLLGQIAGTYRPVEMLTRGDQIKATPLYPLMLMLILVGCFTKSAQCRSISGCPRRWPRPRRCRPTCTRPPWSRPASSCWRGCIR
jgi:hypothetical protein